MARRGAHDRARLVLDRSLPDKLADAVQTRTWMGTLVSIVEVAAMLDDHDLAGQAYDLLSDLAYARRRRDDVAAEDRDRSVALLEHAVAEARAMELTGRADAWEADLARWRQHARRGGKSRPAREPRVGVIRRDGRRWHLAVDGRQARVGKLIGMSYLADLLTSPGQRIPATALTGQGAGPERPVSQPLLDDDARAAYAARARELSVDLADAESDNDVHRAERLRTELDALVDELESATGLGGRPRNFPDQGERARTAVRKAIKRAIDAVDDVEPALAELLRSTISTGATCTYHPDPDRPVVWSASEA